MHEALHWDAIVSRNLAVGDRPSIALTVNLRNLHHNAIGSS